MRNMEQQNTMNKTYKVRATRTGALQVVSELTSSVTSFGTKTVLAAAMGAAFAGAALAATPDWTANDVVIDQEVTVSTGTNFNDSLTIKAGGHLTLKDVGMGVTSGKKGDFTIEQGGKLTVQGDASNNTAQTLDAMNVKITGGEISITGGTDAWQQHASLGGYNTFEMSGGTVTLGDNARLWIGSGGGTESTEGSTPTVTTLTEAMVFKGGDVFMKAGKGKHAIIGTMANGSWANPGTDPQYVQTLSLEGTNLHVDQGEGVLISRDIDMSAGTISVAKDAVLHVLSQKKLTKDDNTGVLVTETNDLTGTFDITGGTVSIAEGGTMNVRTAMTIGGGDTTATVSNAGFFGAYSSAGITIAKNGVFHSTVLNGDTFAAAKITLEEGGVLSMDKLNSNQEGFGPALLVSGKETTALQVELKGGDIRVGGQSYHGDIKIGEATDKGAVTISSGSYRTSSVRFGSATGNSLTIGANGALDVTKLDLTYGNITNNGSLTIGSVVTGETLTETNVVNTGIIYTDVENVLTFNRNKETNLITAATATVFGTAVTGSGDTGKILDSSVTSLTLAEYNAIFGSGDAWLNKLVLTKADITKDAEGTDLGFSDIAMGGITSPSTEVTATATEGTANLDNSAAVTVSNVATDAKTVNVKGTGALTLAGNDGTLFGAATEAVNVTGTLNLGTPDVAKSGTVAAALTVGATEGADSAALAVNAGNFTAAKGLEVLSGSVTVADGASFDVQGGLTMTSGTLTVNGSMGVDYIVAGNGSITVSGGTFAVLDNAPQAAEQVSFKAAPLAAGDESGAYEIVEPITITGTGAKIGLGTTEEKTEAVVAQVYGDAAEQMNVYYLAKQVTLGTGLTTMSLDSSYGVIVDMAGVAATQGYDASKGTAAFGGKLNAQSTDAKISLINLTGAATTGKAGEKSFKLANSVENGTSVKVDYGTIFYGTDTGVVNTLGATLAKDEETGLATALATTGTVAADGTISFEANQTALDAVADTLLGDAVTNAVKNVSFGQNELVDAIVFGIDDAYVAAYNEAIAVDGTTAEEAQLYAFEKVDQALESANEASAMAVLGGAFNVAMEANAEVTKALDRRMSVAYGLERPAQAQGYGVNAWVDVIGTTNEAKRLFGYGMGYEADLYGAVLGADWTAPCGAIIGAALSVGTGDANSVGQTGRQIDNDVDFWGFSLYGSHQIGGFNGKVDIGYVSTSNDLSTSVLGRSVKESVDADVFTFGVGAEYLAKAGSVNVVPHAGVRFSKVDVDDSKFGASYDAMNVWQAPVGVTFSAAFEQAGWKFAPMVDLSVVPAFGDKDAVVEIGSAREALRVVDTNPIQATIGLSAETGAWTFGVHYGLTAGGDDRLNNAFNATAKYAF